MSLEDFVAVFLPYCLQKQPDGTYPVLNREYKPVGFKTRDWIKYEEYPVCVKIKGLTEAKVVKLSYNGSKDMNRIYLYEDASNPIRTKKNMDAYLAKLAMLAKLSVT